MSSAKHVGEWVTAQLHATEISLHNLLTKVDLDLTTEPAVDWLHLESGEAGGDGGAGEEGEEWGGGQLGEEEEEAMGRMDWSDATTILNWV